MTTSADTFLYQNPDLPGIYEADLGGISVEADLERREVKVFVSYPDATDQDYADIQAVLSRLGVPGFHDSWWDDSTETVAVLVAYF